LIVFRGGQAMGEALVAPQSRGQIEGWLRENGAL
ncbi:MAG: thiol reductase thioredoxin, partial [Clostridiales bacterium]